MKTLKNLFSRKFIVTVGALFALFAGGEQSTIHLVIVAIVATAYVALEAFLDAKGMPAIAGVVAESIEDGLRLVREKAEPSTPEAAASKLPEDE